MLICQSRVYLYSGHIKIMGFTLLLNFVSISGVLKHYENMSLKLYDTFHDLIYAHLH